MRRAVFYSLVFFLAACSDETANDRSAVATVRDSGVCIDLPVDRYVMEPRVVADFYTVAISDAATRRPVALLYIGHNPDVDSTLIREVEAHRTAYAARSPVRVEGNDRHPGVQYLGVPSEERAAYFHVLFGSISQREQSAVLRAVHFCS